MFDASSKIQSTILSGNLIDFGGFDQCLSIEEQTNSGVIKGQHCMVEMSPSVKITEILIGYRNLTLKVSFKFLQVKHPNINVCSGSSLLFVVTYRGGFNLTAASDGIKLAAKKSKKLCQIAICQKNG